MTQDEIKAQREREMYGSAYSWYAYHLGYLFTLALVKLSILIFYLSFATRRTFRILVYTCIGMVGIITIAMMLLVALQCPKKPRFALTPGIMVSRERIHCFDLRIIFYCQAAFNMISDLVILVLPMPLLFRLRMDRTKRLLLLVVFSIGLLVPIASGVRLWGLHLWANSGRLARYYGGYMIFWYVVMKIASDIIDLCNTGPKSKSTPQSFAPPRPLCSLCSNAYYTESHLFSDLEAHTTTMEEDVIRHPYRRVPRPHYSGLLDVTPSMVLRAPLRPTSRRLTGTVNRLKQL